jgi:ribosomal protein L11 methyltransferase
MAQWHECGIETTAAQLNTLLAKLSAMGFDQLQIDSQSDFEIFLERKQPWELVDDDVRRKHENINRITLYLSDEHELTRLREGLRDLKECRLSARTVREDDWQDCWKQYYLPVDIGTRLRIQPVWQPLENAGDRAVFYNDPGMSFGTGTHASTLLCLKRLETEIRGGERVLDLGCGSGILFISALLLGAGQALAVDIDETACQTAKRNAERNRVCRYGVLRGDCTADGALLQTLVEFQADLVMANLVADLHIAMAPLWKTLVKPGGRLLASGIISEKAGAVTGATPMTLTARDESDGWAALLFTSPAS